MDAVSALSSVLAILEAAIKTTSALVSYARDVHNASKERRQLADEAYALSGLLERLREQQAEYDEEGQASRWFEERRHLIDNFESAWHDLAKILKIDLSTAELKQQNRFKACLSAARWSFSKSEISPILNRVYRLRQLVNTLLLDEQYTLVRRIDRRQQEDINEKLLETILSWLVPPMMRRGPATSSVLPAKGSGASFVFNICRLARRKIQVLMVPRNETTAGAGKTVIASIAVDYLNERAESETGGQIGVAAIYLKYNDPDQTTANVIASLLAQLLQKYGSIPTSLLQLYDRHQAYRSLPLYTELEDEFLLLIDAFDKVFVVGMFQRFQAQVSLMVTSRFLDSIHEELVGFEQLEIRAHRADIELFIDAQIQKDRNLAASVRRRPELRAEVKKAVLQNAEDIFLLARLHVESLRTAAGISIGHIKKKLKNLPATLDAMYDEAMQRIENQDVDQKSVALKALAWVSYAFRPLSLRELQHALIIEPESNDLDEDFIPDGQQITSLCAGLLTIDWENGLINFIHSTTKAYFDKIRDVVFPRFHANITRSCAAYLNLDILQNATILEIVQSFPLASYAAQHMGDHARQSPEELLDADVLKAICELLSDSDRRKPLVSLLDALDLIRSGFYSPNIKESSNTVTEKESSSAATQGNERMISDKRLETNASHATGTDSWEMRTSRGQVPEVTALHLAASMGLAKVASMLLKEAVNIDAVDESGKTALAIAIERGFEKAVELLVNSGAKVDLRTDQGCTVFLLVVERGWVTTADMIAQKMEQVISEAVSDPFRARPLLLASYHGDLEAVEKLIGQDGSDLQSRDKTLGETALFVAVERLHPRVVQALLNGGVDVNAQDSSGQTALHRATRRESEEIMRLLLDNGADTECKNDAGLTPWSANVRLANERTIRILLDAGADPNTRGHAGTSEIYSAASVGETEYVKRLIKYGTNPSIVTNFDWSPLHWAAANGRIECVEVLIEAGADLSPISDQIVTPLDLALKEGQSAIAELLLRAGAKKYADLLHDSADPGSGLQSSSATKGETVEHKLFMVFDQLWNQPLPFGQFIYPPNPPADHDPEKKCYQISGPLDSPARSISIKYNSHFADAHDYPLPPEKFDHDKTLYEITRIHQDYLDFALEGKTRGCLENVEMHRHWTGTWKIYQVENEEDKATLLFRCNPDPFSGKSSGQRWTNADGELLAKTWRNGPPSFCLEPNVNQLIKDILVACWVAKLWSEVNVQRNNL